MNMWMSFTFWQRFYPKLIIGFVVWMTMGYWASEAGAPHAYTLWGWIIGIVVAFLGLADAFAQARFRIWHNRVNRYRQAARRGEYDNRWEL